MMDDRPSTGDLTADPETDQWEEERGPSDEPPPCPRDLRLAVVYPSFKRAKAPCHIRLDPDESLLELRIKFREAPFIE
jgi:hypothetical protein